MQLIWTLVRDALQPLRLRDVGRCLEPYVTAIRRSNGPSYSRQRERLGLVACAQAP